MTICISSRTHAACFLLEPPARRLDGAKALIDRFVSLGMPLALESDDFLRAMLYGTQSLMDRRQIQDAYDAAAVVDYVSLRSFNYPPDSCDSWTVLASL
jgi:hypothetical protein